jgi:crotonobetainyl-CoA:carnitine CoA-transferase CaiB-like acyl-CoA transferase
MVAEVAAGEPVPPMPARRSAWAIYETFPTADDHMIFVGLTSNNHWQRFCEAFGLGDLRADPTLQTNEQRVEARPRLVPIVAAVIKSHSMAGIAQKLEELHIPYAPVARPGDLFEDPHLNHGGRMHRIDVGDGRYANIPGIPVEIGGESMPLRRQPPRAGEHTAEILRDMGLSEDELARLDAQGAIRMEGANR